MSIVTIALLRNDTLASAGSSEAFDGRGLRIERIAVNASEETHFKWSGDRHYLAIHNLKMVDGETRAPEAKPFRLLDLRGRMTYLPPGAEISGWSKFPARANNFTMITFDLSTVAEGYFAARSTDLRPSIYFGDPSLGATMMKIHSLLQYKMETDPILLETLGVLAVAEMVLGAAGFSGIKVGVKLSASQQRLIADYIDGNLARKISLSELAGITNLNRFYFTRCFGATFGMSPYQFVLMKRLEKSKELLKSRRHILSIGDIAAAVGFASASQFSLLFKRACKMTPRDYRLSAR